MKYLSFFLFGFIHASLLGQNLVPNPGFEEYTFCPGYYNQSPAEFRAKDWRSAGLGTPDHFHSCSKGEADVPYNWAGVADSFEGQGYAGIYLWMDNDRNYREYLECRLTQSLIKDTTYLIEFQFRQSSYSKYCIDRIGLLLADSLVQLKHDRVFNAQPTLLVLQDSALTQQTGYWERAAMEYKAKGGEQFVVIGNFSSDAETHYYKIQFQPDQQEMLKQSAYYYVDAVTIIPKFSIPQLPDDAPSDFTVDAEFDKTYILKNIQFEFDSYKLKSRSFDELDRVVSWMRKHPESSVTLSGHTDDVGGDRYNLNLSTNRAKSVGQYLMRAGISEKRIQVVGFGKQNPLVQGDSEEARAVNRRVEIRFE